VGQTLLSDAIEVEVGVEVGVEFEVEVGVDVEVEVGVEVEFGGLIFLSQSTPTPTPTASDKSVRPTQSFTVSLLS
jgi:hypothetical protein